MICRMLSGFWVNEKLISTLVPSSSNFHTTDTIKVLTTEFGVRGGDGDEDRDGGGEGEETM